MLIHQGLYALRTLHVLSVIHRSTNPVIALYLLIGYLFPDSLPISLVCHNIGFKRTFVNIYYAMIKDSSSFLLFLIGKKKILYEQCLTEGQTKVHKVFTKGTKGQ